MSKLALVSHDGVPLVFEKPKAVEVEDRAEDLSLDVIAAREAQRQSTVANKKVNE